MEENCIGSQSPLWTEEEEEEGLLLLLLLLLLFHIRVSQNDHKS
jgi:hypothetical protein